MTTKGGEGEAERWRQLAERLADVARPVVMEWFRRGVAVEDKSDASPVTLADRGAEAAIRAVLEAEAPDHGILGEEHGRQNLDAEWVWVIDPIDGTKSFITGKPLFGTLIGLCRWGRPVLGVIDAPALGDRWVGVTGEATTFNGRTIRVRPCADLGQAYLCATTPEMFLEQDGTAAPFARLSGRVKHTLWGSDCHAYGYLASGWIDLVCEAQLQPYDYCAVAPVIEGAGGTVTDWTGAPLSIHSTGRVLAAGDPRTHAQALAALKG